MLLALLTMSAFGSVDETLTKDWPRLRAFYEDVHAHPELSLRETRTARKVAAEFRALKLETREKVGGTGVVGVLRNGEGPTTLVRAELDALPLQEESGRPYASREKGVMHACGHDVHLTALVGTARAMVADRADWKGTLVFVAQPAEEISRGALAMLKDGLLDKIPKIDRALALHTSGQLAAGAVSVTPGFALASVDSINVTFKGVGTHGSSPENGVDPFVQMAEFTLKVQTLLGREKPAGKPAVISVGSVHGGTKHNIIPEDVKLQLTMRTFDPQVRSRLKIRVRELAESIAKMNLAPAPIVEIKEAAQATFNDPELLTRVKSAIESALGPVVDGEPAMAGEDFGQFGRAAGVPSLMFTVGARDDNAPAVTNHSPRFAPDFDVTGRAAIRAMSAALRALHK